jgi:hypothetical protein
LERAVLQAIALQVPEAGEAMASQLESARVVTRENTGAGFFTTFEMTSAVPPIGVSSPLGDVGATIQGLVHGLGFLLWLKDGRIDQLEGHSYDESTSGLDLMQVGFASVGPLGVKESGGLI